MIGVPIARIRGIEIRVQLGWIFVVALVAALAVIEVGEAVPTLAAPVQWLLGGAVGLAFFGSAMVHDLAHALTARRRGVDVQSVLVSFFGGTAPGEPESAVAADDLAIAASGPIVSTLIGLTLGAIAVGMGAAVGEFGRAGAQLVALLAALNLLIGMVNLVPAYPLDGGRIVRAMAWRRTGSLARGWAVASRTGRLSGLVAVAIGGGLFLAGEVTNGGMVALSGWFLILSSRAIRERLKVDALIGDLSVGDVMERDPATIHPGLTVDTVAGQLLDNESTTSAVLVVDGTEVVGILGVREVRRLRPAARGTTRVRDAMVRAPRMPVVGPDARLLDALERLQRSGLDGIPVIDDGRLLGVLTRRAVGKVVHLRTGGEPPSRRRGFR